MTRRLLAVALAAVTFAAAPPALATADDGWRSEQPTTPGAAAPAALGRVYDLRFWAPNRGVLITTAGLWAYDGTGWHQLSTVCGGTGGRIAWAGPLDFWTVSDQAVGQSNVDKGQLARRSLCHVVGGRVVASYAQPVGTAGEYEPMNAAVCLAPDDCWFGGEPLPGTAANAGAFHLHWDGTSLTAYPSPTVHSSASPDPDGAVTDLAAFQGGLYESVSPAGTAAGEEPDLLHQVYEGDPPTFLPIRPAGPIDYGTDAQGGANPPAKLAGFQLATDGGRLWAAAGTADGNVRIPVNVLTLQPAGFTPLTLSDPAGALAPATQVASIAAEPGTDDAWVAYVPAGELGGQVPQPARLARVHADGTVDGVTALPGPADGLARKGQADRVACPDAGQCWLATRSGWLFHLGGDLPQDTAPEMHRLITFRPQDAATIIVPPDTRPDDTSGIAPPVIQEPPPDRTPVAGGPSATSRARKLVTGVRSRVVRRTTLELTFTLTAKAHVQLVAKRRGRVVARTPKATLAKGRHRLRLRLSARRWPTKLDFRVTAYRSAER